MGCIRQQAEASWTRSQQGSRIAQEVSASSRNAVKYPLKVPPSCATGGVHTGRLALRDDSGKAGAEKRAGLNESEAKGEPG